MSSSNQKDLFNYKIGKIFLSLFLFGLPLFTVTEANADMHDDMNHGSETMEEMDRDNMEPEQDSMDNEATLDGSADGEPVVVVAPKEGEDKTIDVMVVNNTNAAIDYQAIGHTENRTLEGGEKYVMEDLPLPVVIRSARQDDGFIKILPLTNPEKNGMLEVTLNEDPEFYDDDNLGVVRIEEDGGVFIN